MGTTTKGIIYPSDYLQGADVPKDMKKMAESIDEIIEDLDDRKANESDLVTLMYELFRAEGRLDTAETDILARALITETGNKIALEINNQTYVLKAKLYDKNNNLINTSNEIDLPLETMVVNGSYDSTNKKIILTLKNGNTVEFSVADLVSGLQSEITNENKLSSDLVDDTNKTNKFMTQAEKTKLEELENYDDTEIKDDIEELQEENERLRNDLNNSTLTIPGTGENVTLENTTDARFKKFGVEGNKKQETREGYNLLNFDVSGQSSKVTVNNDGTVTINGTGGFSLKFAEITLQANTTYKEKIEVVSGTVDGDIETSFLSFNSDDTLWLKTTNYVTYIPSENKVKSTIWLNANTTFNNLRVKIWGYEGTTEKPYEQYGVSPSPDFPSPVYAVGDNGSVNITICNKNLVDFYNIPYRVGNHATITKNGKEYTVVNASDGYYDNCGFSQNNIKLKPNTTYTFSAKVKSTTNSDGSSVYVNGKYLIHEQDRYGRYGNYATAGNRSYVTFTTPSTIPDDAYVGLYPIGISNTAVFTDIQIEEGTVATTYTDHEEQVLTLTLGNIELCKIDTAKDYFFKNVVGSKYYNAELTVDKWYLHKEVEKKVLNGTETGWSYNATTDYYRYFLTSDIGIKEPASSSVSLKAKIFSPMFVAESMAGTWEGRTGISTQSSNSSYNYVRLCLCYVSSDTSNITKFKAWLSNNNVPVYYQLQAPTNTEITDITLINQLEAIAKAKSYYEQTNIYSTDDVSPNFDVEAVGDINKYDLNEIDNIKQAIVALGGVI